MRKPVLIIGGCLVLLLLVCCVGLFAFVLLGNPGQMVAGLLGESELGGVSATLQAVGPTVAAAATKAPSGATLPTLTRATPAAGSSGDAFASAMANAKTATKFRVELSWIFGGMQQGKYQETPFMDFRAEVDGQNSHMISNFAGLAMETTEAGGKSYTKGLLGPDPNAWYQSNNSATSSSVADFAKVDMYKDWVSGSSTDFKKARSEQLDGQSCDVYLYDMKSVQNSALAVLLSSAKDKTDFSAIDKGEMNFWYCGDGYVHKFVLDYEGHDAKDTTQKAALKMTWHAWDFNNNAITITAPKDYKTLSK